VSAHAVGQLLLGLAGIIALARVLGALARRVGQPPVVGEILAGVLLGPTLFGTVVSDHLFPAEVRPALSGLANVGLVLFMFIIGYELDHTLVRERKRVAVSVSVGSIVVPLGLGIALATWLAGRHAVPHVLPFALFMGAAMSVTAFPVLARILTDRGMLRTEIGGIALASGAVDDVVAWSLLAGVVAVGAADATAAPWQIVLAVPYVLVMVLIVRPMLRRLAAARERAGRLTPDILGVILVGLLLSCFTTEWLGVHAIFGAFLFGAVMPRTGGEKLRHEILERLEQVSVLLLLPVFFVLAGLKVDLSTVGGAGLLELGAILLVAITGKFVGAYAGARLHRIPARPAGALATLMNTRGLTEIVILTVGAQLGILDDKLFSLMVVMALVTTMMAGPLLALIYPRRFVERDVAEAERAALGGTDAYRVLVVVPSESAAPVVELAADLAGPRRPAEVILSRLLPQPAAPIEVGAGLSGELLTMTATMGELARLAAPVRARGLAAPVLARFSGDPAGDLDAQIRTAEPDVVIAVGSVPACPDADTVAVDAALPGSWQSVMVRVDGGGTDADAALRVGARLAAARAVDLLVDAGPKPGRRVLAAVEELNDHGVATRLGPAAPASALVVGGADASGAHIRVRAAAHAPRTAAAEWVPALTGAA
jgi:Kef-type K+ transport system membrane component KefB